MSTFVKKAFDHAPRKVLWWAIRRAGVEDWVLCALKAMYEKAKSCVHVNGQFSGWFIIKVGIHQGAALSPLLFITVMEALSREFRVVCPWESL